MADGLLDSLSCVRRHAHLPTLRNPRGVKCLKSHRLEDPDRPAEDFHK